jgi:hypothetical protein
MAKFCETEILMITKHKGVRVGFDRDDEAQERALGRLMAERRKPGDYWAARSRGIVRVARHRLKERKWNMIRVSLSEANRCEVGLKMAAIELREIMDMLPYAASPSIMKLIEDDVKAVLEGNNRKLKKAARLIRSVLGNKLKID